MPDRLPDTCQKEDTKDWKKEYHLLKKQYDLIINNFGDTYIELDLTGTTTFINDNEFRFLGYSNEEFIGRNYKEHMSPETAKKIYNIYNTVYKTGKPARGVEYDLITKNGTIKFAQDTILLRRDQSGKPIGFASFTRDITEKKFTEIALKENEEKYRNILENIGDAYIEVDLSGTVTFLNKNATLILGYNQDEFVGMNYKEFSSPENSESLFNIYLNVLKTGKPNTKAVYELIAKDGSSKIVEAYIDVLYDSAGSFIGFKTVARDITHQKKAEFELKKSEEKYRTILDNMLESYIETDLKGNVIFANKSACEGMGYTKEEFIGMNHNQFSSPQTAKESFMIYNTVYKTGKPAIRESFELIAKDGSIKIFESYIYLIRDESDKPIGFKTLRRNITEKKKAEDALKKSEEKYRNILNNMLDGYWEMDLSGTITFLNKSACETLHYEKEEYIGMSYKEICSPETAKKLFRIFNTMYKTGKPDAPVEYDLIAKDGAKIIVESAVDLIQDVSGKPTGFSALTRNITQKKQEELEKEKLEAHLQYAQKMESIGTLAGGIAHDFNNLLMGILGLNSLMMADTDTSHPHYEYLTEVESYIKNAVDLTRQLLGFARGGKYEVIPTDLNEIIKNHNRMFGRTRKEISIKGTYDNNLWIVEVDQSQIRQVLMNIYLNAWQAMPDGGDLYIKTENVILDKDYTVPFNFTPGKYTQTSITDNGIGMDENTLQRIFDPFFTTREKERGTGLGMPSALGIIKNHGGFITVYSEPGEGSTFNIYIPASKKKMVDEKTTKEITLTGSGTVLIIDDEKMILNVGEKILKRLGYNVIIAKDGNEGLDKYNKNMEKIDLVILDMIMPRISGSDVYESLKKLNSDVKVLLASGYSLDGKAKSLLDKGCNGFIQKPFNMKQLSQKVSDILAS